MPSTPSIFCLEMVLLITKLLILLSNLMHTYLFLQENHYLILSFIKIGWHPSLSQSHLSKHLICSALSEPVHVYTTCRHPNLYRLIHMVPGLSDKNSRSLIRRMCVENHLESSRKRVQKLPFNLRGVCLF